MIRRTLRAIAALLIAWLGVLTVQPGAAAVVITSQVHAYVYDGHHKPVMPNTSATERGPPLQHHRDTTYDPDVSPRLGALARTVGATPPSTYNYDAMSHLVRTASGSRAVQERPAGSAAADVVVVERSDVAAKTADDWPVISGIVRDASKGKGNFGLGAGTRGQADDAGRAWVGDGYTIASDGKTLVSSDSLRQLRPPSYKPNLDMWQANFEQRLIPRGAWQGNGHLDILDP
ncbi:MAG: hypothetical protein Q8Q52_07815 [Acidimicrobiia bacterium]|nr:hypothetical protein [Acidimicrobiia bacterium]